MTKGDDDPDLGLYYVRVFIEEHLREFHGEAVDPRDTLALGVCAAQRTGLGGRRWCRVYTATDPFAGCVLMECVELEDLKRKDEQ